MTRRQVTVRLNETELAQVDVLAKGVSLDQWLREALSQRVKLRIKANELLIEAFKSALALQSGGTEESGSRVQKLEELLVWLQDENLTLYKSENE